MSIVLIIEDEYAIGDLLDMVLTDADYQVHRAANGRQALDLLSQGLRPDLVITDFMMPVLDGAETIREMRRDPTFRDLPYIVMSSLPEGQVQERMDGYAAFLRKPFSLMRIVPLVECILFGKRGSVS